MKYATKENWLIFAVFSIGLLGFLISFSALSELAFKSGAVGIFWLSYVFAIMVDFFIVVIGAAWLWAKINSKKSYGYMFLMILWTSISIVLNLYHAPNNTTAKFISVLPPLMIFVACHVGWGIIEAEAKEKQNQTTAKNLDEEIKQLSQEVNQLTNKKNQIETDLKQLPQSKTQLSNEVNSLTNTVNQLLEQESKLTKQVNQSLQELTKLGQDKIALQKFFDSLSNSRSTEKQKRTKQLIKELLKTINQPERNIKRDFETIEEKLKQ